MYYIIIIVVIVVIIINVIVVVIVVIFIPVKVVVLIYVDIYIDVHVRSISISSSISTSISDIYVDWINVNVEVSQIDFHSLEIHLEFSRATSTASMAISIDASTLSSIINFHAHDFQTQSLLSQTRVRDDQKSDLSVSC